MSKPLSKCEMIHVRADSLRVHPLAQRDILPTKLNRLVDNLDLDAIGVLHAVRYKIGSETANWVIDGQHRLAALLKVGFGEWLVEVKVHLEATDDARAAALFLKLNDRSSVRPFDKFKNEVLSNVPAAVGAVEVCKKWDLEIAKAAGDRSIACVNAIKRLYMLDGGRTLYKTLQVAIGAWGLRAETYDGKLIQGIGQALIGKNGSLDLTALIMKLSKYPGGAAGLLGDARGLRKYKSGSLPSCVAERVIDLYNSKRSVSKVANIAEAK